MIWGNLITTLVVFTILPCLFAYHIGWLRGFKESKTIHEKFGA